MDYLKIPVEILQDDDLTMTERVLLAEIVYLSSLNKDNICYASNEHLANMIHVNKRQTIRSIKNLETKNKIKITYISQQKRQLSTCVEGLLITSDNMSPVTECHYDNMSPQLVTKCHPTSDNMSPQLVTKCHPTSDKMSPKNINRLYIENNKEINKEINTENNILCHSVIEYLNEKAGKNFKATIAKTKTLIKARAKEGFTLQDFQTVIDKKCRQWKGTEMEKYLRPETLFGTKFEGYLNESNVVTLRAAPAQETPTERVQRMIDNIMSEETQ